MRASGKVARGKIGIVLGEVSKEMASGLGLSKAQGALVRQVEKAGPAAKAGVQPGDIILRFEGRLVEKAADLPRMVGTNKPGTKVTLQIWREGSTREVAMTLVEFAPEPTLAARQAPGGTAKADVKPNELGLVVTDLSEAKRAEADVVAGVQVESADGAAARAGIRSGDLLLSFNNQKILNAKQFNVLIAKADLKKPNSLLIRRGDSADYVVISPAR